MARLVVPVLGTQQGLRSQVRILRESCRARKRRKEKNIGKNFDNKTKFDVDDDGISRRKMKKVQPIPTTVEAADSSPPALEFGT